MRRIDLMHQINARGTFLVSKYAIPHLAKAAEIAAAGGRALALAVDVREEAAVKEAIERTAAHFGAIDIVVNNASAIALTKVADTGRGVDGPRQLRMLRLGLRRDRDIGAVPRGFECNRKADAPRSAGDEQSLVFE
jgi:NAD(P)-dependent dehydrogenase (short-subunit alcohol dehydrogenase family)